MYPLLVIVGPTAVGKTDFSLSLAGEINGEIISADSMQIYEEMDIGTAKATPKERELVPHHLVDCIPPDQEFTVADFQERAEILIPEIYYRGSTPMLVGGTGLYVQSVVEGFIFPEMETDWDFRREMEELAEEKGTEFVHDKLKKVDPELASQRHPNDLRRVIRGLEVHKQTGKTVTYWNERADRQPRRYNDIKIGLRREREELYDRINRRVDIMIEEGLIDEVKGLLETGYDRDLISMQGLGYKEIIGYLEGDHDLERAIYLLKRDTRHFAKRQLTWFRRDDNIHWLNTAEMSTEEMVAEVKEIIENSNWE